MGLSCMSTDDYTVQFRFNLKHDKNIKEKMIKDIELFHGAVLTKLMRNYRPVALSMVETRPDEGSFYTINDEAEFYIKYKNGLKGKKGPISWTFTFTSEEIKKLKTQQQKSGQLFVALVCTLSDKEYGKMQIAFFDPHKNKGIDNVLDFDENTNQAFTIKDNLKGMLVVAKKQQEIMKISRGALDNWVALGR